MMDIWGFKIINLLLEKNTQICDKLLINIKGKSLFIRFAFKAVVPLIIKPFQNFLHNL